ncbi:MAG: VOC family protein [Alphaproteobacteria bacterium]|nr:VOC family protein [Alphaproteobacteria bacterium]
MISGIDHVVLTVRDIKASAAFYGDILGMRVEKFANDRVAVHFGSQKINLQTLGQETRNKAGIGSGDLCLVSGRTIDEIAAHLTAKGVDIIEGPVSKTGACGPITSFYFNDLDQNLIEISSYERPLS